MKNNSASYLEFKAVVNKRERKQWKQRTIKIFDNAKLQWFKLEDNSLKYKGDIDLLKVTRFGKSAKHHNCVEVFVKAPLVGVSKHKFQFDEFDLCVSFMKNLAKFANIPVHNIEDSPSTMSQHQKVTVDDLERSHLTMNECPKGKVAVNFEFPDC